jgi:hypothetical protein
LDARSEDRIAESCNQHIAWKTFVLPEGSKVHLGDVGTVGIVKPAASDVLKTNYAHAMIDIMGTFQVRAERPIL